LYSFLLNWIRAGMAERIGCSAPARTAATDR
jgi:hypothetical protein